MRGCGWLAGSCTLLPACLPACSLACSNPATHPCLPACLPASPPSQGQALRHHRGVRAAHRRHAVRRARRRQPRGGCGSGLGDGDGRLPLTLKLLHAASHYPPCAPTKAPPALQPLPTPQVLCRDGRAIGLTRDHKPASVPEERARIEAQGAPAVLPLGWCWEERAPTCAAQRPALPGGLLLLRRPPVIIACVDAQPRAQRWAPYARGALFSSHDGVSEVRPAGGVVGRRQAAPPGLSMPAQPPGLQASGRMPPSQARYAREELPMLGVQTGRAGGASPLSACWPCCGSMGWRHWRLARPSVSTAGKPSGRGAAQPWAWREGRRSRAGGGRAASAWSSDVVVGAQPAGGHQRCQLAALLTTSCLLSGWRPLDTAVRGTGGSAPRELAQG